LFWGHVSDKIGRRWAFTLTLLFASIFGLITAFVPNYPMMLVAQLLTGFGLGGALPVDGAMFAEFIDKQKRGRLLVLLSVFWILGPLFASGLSWALIPSLSCHDRYSRCAPESNLGWRYVLGICSICNFMMLLSRWGIPESPHWYYKNGKKEKAIEVLKRICVQNSVNFPDVKLADPTFHSVNFCETLKNRKMVVTFVLLLAIWICVLSGYDGFNSFLPILMEAKGIDNSETIYRNMFIYMSAGLPGSLLGSYLVDTFLGRRWTLFVSAILSAISMFLFLLLNSETELLLFSSIFQFMVQIVWASMATYTPEYFSNRYPWYSSRFMFSHRKKCCTFCTNNFRFINCRSFTRSSHICKFWSDPSYWIIHPRACSGYKRKRFRLICRIVPCQINTNQ